MIVTAITGLILAIFARSAVALARGQFRVEAGRSSMVVTGARGGQEMAGTGIDGEPDIVTKISPRPVTGTVSRLTELLQARDLKLFAVIDQRAEALQAGLELREITLVIFGSPAAGTPVMAAAPLAALDLPLKVLVWADEGHTKVSYYAPAALAARHHLSADLAGRLAGIGPLTDALIAS